MSIKQDDDFVRGQVTITMGQRDLMMVAREDLGKIAFITRGRWELSDVDKTHPHPWNNIVPHKVYPDEEDSRFTPDDVLWVFANAEVVIEFSEEKDFTDLMNTLAGTLYGDRGVKS